MGSLSCNSELEGTKENLYLMDREEDGITSNSSLETAIKSVSCLETRDQFLASGERMFNVVIAFGASRSNSVAL